MEISKELESLIEDIPGQDGWWCTSTGDAFRKAADTMTKSGMTVEDIMSVLEGLHGAISSEYGC